MKKEFVTDSVGTIAVMREEYLKRLADRGVTINYRVTITLFVINTLESVTRFSSGALGLGGFLKRLLGGALLSVVIGFSVATAWFLYRAFRDL
jgi:hypothetical protein